jgi:hypothetical protein
LYAEEAAACCHLAGKIYRWQGSGSLAALWLLASHKREVKASRVLLDQVEAVGDEITWPQASGLATEAIKPFEAPLSHPQGRFRLLTRSKGEGLPNSD